MNAMKKVDAKEVKTNGTVGSNGGTGNGVIVRLELLRGQKPLRDCSVGKNFKPPRGFLGC
ncbi:MAG: hypothetical protein V1822_01250 [Candidatus Micrarchaeota archaeon]